MLMKISIFCFSRETYYRRDLHKSARNPVVHPLGSILEKWFRDDFSDNGLGIFQVQNFFSHRFGLISLDNDPTELLAPIDVPFAHFRPSFWSTPFFSVVSHNDLCRSAPKNLKNPKNREKAKQTKFWSNYTPPLSRPPPSCSNTPP